MPGEDPVGFDENPPPLSKDRERAIEDIGRQAGAALRSPAPADGAKAIAQRARTQRAVRIAGAGLAALLLAGAGFVALTRDGSPVVNSPVDTVEQPQRPTDTDSLPSSTTSIPASTATSTVPPPRLAIGSFSATPTASVEVVEPFTPIAALTLSSDGTQLYVSEADPPEGLKLGVYDSETLAFQHELTCPVKHAGTAFAWDQEASRAWDQSARAALSAMRRRGAWTLDCPVTFSPDGSRASGTFYVEGAPEFVTTLWNADDGTEIARLEGFAHSFSPDSSRLAGSSLDGTVSRVWDTRSGQLLGEVTPSTAAGLQRDGPAFSPDGTRFVTVGSVIEIWDTATFVKVGTITPPQPFIEPSQVKVAFTSDGARLAIAQTDSASIWDASTGEELLRFEPTRDVAIGPWVLAVDFTPDDSMVMTQVVVNPNSGSSWDVHLFDAKTGQQIELPNNGSNVVGTVAVAINAIDSSMVTQTSDSAGVYRLRRWTYTKASPG